MAHELNGINPKNELWFHGLSLCDSGRTWKHQLAARRISVRDSVCRSAGQAAQPTRKICFRQKVRLTCSGGSLSSSHCFPRCVPSEKHSKVESLNSAE